MNPLREIAALTRTMGALLVVDAVASVGAEPLEIDAWDLDLVVLSAQKALAGPTGASAVVVSERAWEWSPTTRPRLAPRSSRSSTGRGAGAILAGPRSRSSRITPRCACSARPSRLRAAEGLEAIVARHAAARDGCRPRPPHSASSRS